MADFYAGNAMPGPGAVAITAERQSLLGPAVWHLLKGITLKSTASDAGNSPTTELRHGLLLGKVLADGLYEHYQPAVATGPQMAEGALFEPRRMTDTDGNAVNRPAQMVIAAYIKSSQLLLLDSQARAQLHGRFIFDDDLVGNRGPYKQELAKTSAYTVGSGSSAALESGSLFTNTGAVAGVTFTLPTLAAGLVYDFQAVADFAITIASAAGDDMVVPNDASADSVAFSTAGDIIGAHVRVRSNAAGTKWYVEKLCSNAMTIAT